MNSDIFIDSGSKSGSFLNKSLKMIKFFFKSSKNSPIFTKVKK